MLKTSYDELEDIPENLRAAYIPKDGKYVLDDLSTDHPVVTKRDELLRENTSQKSAITKLTNEKTALEGTKLPEGHVAVPAADKALLDAVKPYGAATEVKAKLDEHATLKTRETERASQDKWREAARVMGWNEDALVAIGDKLPDLEVRDLMENGQVVKDEQGQNKKIVIARLKGDNGVITEKPFSEHFVNTPSLKIFEPSLKPQGEQQPGRTLPAQPATSGGGGAGTDIVSQLLKQDEEARKNNPNPLMVKSSTLATAGAAATKP